MRMKINYLKETGIDKLKEADINRNMKYYKKNKNTWLADRYKIGEIFSVYDKKEFENFKLRYDMEDKAEEDFQNMKIIYHALKDLTDTQASDERIWAGLAHEYCWDYMTNRWSLQGDEKKDKRRVLNRYFFQNSTKAVFLNGISRLWWYARVSYEEENEDNPYELTEYICKNDSNGKIFPLLACCFASNRKVFRTIIKTIKTYEEENKIKLTREEFNGIKMYLNRLSGKILLDILPSETLEEKIKVKLEEIENKREKTIVKNITENDVRAKILRIPNEIFEKIAEEGFYNLVIDGYERRLKINKEAKFFSGVTEFYKSHHYMDHKAVRKSYWSIDLEEKKIYVELQD